MKTETITRIQSNNITAIFDTINENAWTLTEISFGETKLNFKVTGTKAEDNGINYYAEPLFIRQPEIHAGVLIEVCKAFAEQLQTIGVIELPKEEKPKTTKKAKKDATKL